MTSEVEQREGAFANLLYSHLHSGIVEPGPSSNATTLEQAYRIQQKLVDLGGGCAGWKIAPPQASHEPLCSPLPSCIMGGNGASLPRRAGQSMRAEVELALTLSDSISKLQPISRSAVAACIDTWHVAIEILSSRLPPNAGWRDRTADIQSSSAVILGLPRPFTYSLASSSLPMLMRFDEHIVGQASSGPGVGQILDMVLWLSRHALARGLPLKGGDVIITGARVKPVDFEAPVRISAKAEGFAPVEVHFS